MMAGTSSTTDRGIVSSATREPAGIVRGVLKLDMSDQNFQRDLKKVTANKIDLS